MSAIHEHPPTKRVYYPDTDGLPMAENTRQYEWIVTIKGGVDAVFDSRPDVFVAGDLFWYPVEGDNTIRVAPDVLAVFGRPKGHRGSYLQWKEGGIAPQVAFEIYSPGNRLGEMMRKLMFYEKYGVQEYYIYDPFKIELEIFRREGDELKEVPETDIWTSPLLSCRFDMTGDELVIYGPDGKRFRTFQEIVRDEAAQAKLTEEERLARLQAQRRANEAELRAERLAAKMRQLGINPDSPDAAT